MRPSLSVCMIIKNEESNLGECLEQFGSIDAEIIVVDTGSNDRGPDIARSFGAKVLEFGFRDDFSAPRNFSIEQAQGEWIFVIDADERVDVAALNDLLERAEDRKDVGGYIFQRNNYVYHPEFCSYTDSVVRLFRNLPTIRYRGRVHEKPDEAIAGSGYRIEESGVVIKHLVFRSRKQGILDAKTDRYIQLLEKEIEERPHEFQLWFMLGTERFKQGDSAASLRAFEKCVGLKKGYGRAWNGIGIILGQKGDYGGAIEAFETAIETDRDCGEFYHNLATVYLKKGELERVQELLEKAWSLDQDAATLVHLAEIAVRRGDLHEGGRYAADAVERDPLQKKGWLLLLKTAIQKGDIVSARRHAQGMREIFPDDPTVISITKPLLKR